MDMFLSLRLFVSAVELGSFSKAARAYNFKVSSVSRQISSLEQDLGTTLFRRSTRQLLLTDAGMSLYDRAVRILADLEEARRSTATSASEAVGTLRLCAPIDFGRLHLTPLLPEFMASRPGLSVDVTLTDQTTDFESGRFDVSVIFGDPADNRLFAQKLAPNSYVICCARSYVDRATEPKFPSGLGDYNCITGEEHETWQFGSDRSTVEIAVTVAGNFRSNRREPILQAALAGAGFARLPLWLAGPHLRSGALVRILTNYRCKCHDDAIYGIYPEKRTASPKIRAFLDFLMSKIDTPPSWELG
jgi:DNA-binding transcriptional LysR family regulator